MRRNLDKGERVNKHSMTSPAEELRRILSRLPRHDPPDIPLERLLLQLAAARRRTFAAVAGAIAAGLILAMTIRTAPENPPVHLDLHVVHVDPADDSSSTPRPTAGEPAVFENP